MEGFWIIIRKSLICYIKIKPVIRSLKNPELENYSVTQTESTEFLSIINCLEALSNGVGQYRQAEILWETNKKSSDMHARPLHFSLRFPPSRRFVRKNAYIWARKRTNRVNEGRERKQEMSTRNPHPWFFMLPWCPHAMQDKSDLHAALDLRLFIQGDILEDGDSLLTL